ncbi:MAG: DUF1573 domain-containing protein [Bacteroidetes bacterium]|nr:DUF1573 domain-containing protein [Bacteroidota bacterium]
MKSRLFALALFLLSLCEINAQAKFVVKDSKKNFGFVKKGEVVKIEYEITNEGNEPLVITGAEISCSCTKVEYSPQPISPGKTIKFYILFDTKTVYDRQDRTLEVLSNDPKGPKTLRYKGIILDKN